LMLGLIAEHLKRHNTDSLPDGTRDLFDGHIVRQMELGREYPNRYPLTDPELLLAAKSIAVTMLLTTSAGQPGVPLSLSSPRDELVTRCSELSLPGAQFISTFALFQVRNTGLLNQKTKRGI
jgi:hypothetical protein